MTLIGEDIEPGEFTLEDEFRVAAATASASRLRRVLPFFRGDGDLLLPKLGELDAASRRRVDIGRMFEEPDGWKPMLVDFLEASECEIDALVSQPFWRTTGYELALPCGHGANRRLRRGARAVCQVPRQRHPDGEELRPGVRHAVRATPLHRRAESTWRATTGAIETAISQYLDAYSAVLNLLAEAVCRRVRYSRSSTWIRSCLSVLALMTTCSTCECRCLAHGIRSSSRSASWSSTGSTLRQRRTAGLAKQHRRLASLFERVDGFRVIPGFDADSLGLDVSFAFPTSDPGWHLAVASGAFSALAGSTFGSLRGLGEELRRSQGLRSSLYLAGTDLWSESFVRSFQRSHPSRRQLGLRVSRGLDARPVVDSCARLLGDQRARSGRLGALLPGGIHLFLEERLDERQQLPWQQPAVFVYEALEGRPLLRELSPRHSLAPTTRRGASWRGFRAGPRKASPCPGGAIEARCSPCRSWT